MRRAKAYRVLSRFACRRFLRQTFHEFAAYSRFSSPWAHAYYDQMRLRNASHHAAVRAFKWIRILYRCWKNRTAYDEALYTQAPQRRGSPLVVTLVVFAGGKPRSIRAWQGLDGVITKR